MIYAFLVILVLLAIATAIGLWRFGYFDHYSPVDEMEYVPVVTPVAPMPAPVVPSPVIETSTTTPVVAAPTSSAVNPDAGPLYWDTPKHIYHAVRVTCDLNNLSVAEKNILCECIYQESRFNNGAINHNKNSAGVTLSTDYGICQINDYYHIGPGKDFPSVAYVLEHPDKVFEWMIGMYKKGLLKQWVSYSSGAYKQWGHVDSPMWDLAD